MLNIKKYETELKPFGTQFAITKDGKIKDCQEIECEACTFNYAPEDNCDKVRLEWLLKEYKEPLLTDKEKSYLKSVIEPKRNDVVYIEKRRKYFEQENEHNTINVYVRNPYNLGLASLLLDFVVTEDMPFEGMELFKKYTLEELGL